MNCCEGNPNQTYLYLLLSALSLHFEHIDGCCYQKGFCFLFHRLVSLQTWGEEC